MDDRGVEQAELDRMADDGCPNRPDVPQYGPSILHPFCTAWVFDQWKTAFKQTMDLTLQRLGKAIEVTDFPDILRTSINLAGPYRPEDAWVDNKDPKGQP